MKDLAFVTDKVIAQEVAIGLLINSLLQMYPEVATNFVNSLAHVLQSSPIPTAGARANLELLHEQVSRHLPTPSIGH